MTAITGWIGKERPVSGLTSAFLVAEEIDRENEKNFIRTKDGKSSISTVLLHRRKLYARYSHICDDEPIITWARNISHIKNSRFMMGSITRSFPRSPSTVLRTVDDQKFIMSTSGYATELAHNLRLSLTEKGDVDAIADWVVERGLQNIEETLDIISGKKKSMYMAFAHYHPIQKNAEVFLLRSREHPLRAVKTPVLHYSKMNGDDGIVYASLPDEAVKISNGNYLPVPEHTIYKFDISLKE